MAKNWSTGSHAGKRPGGFCTSSMLSKESRMFMTYNESLGDVLTLAHESGQRLSRLYDARLMSQGQYVTQRFVVGHKDARFFAQHGASAETAGLFRARSSQSTQFLPITCP